MDYQIPTKKEGDAGCWFKLINRWINQPGTSMQGRMGGGIYIYSCIYMRIIFPCPTRLGIKLSRMNVDAWTVISITTPLAANAETFEWERRDGAFKSIIGAAFLCGRFPSKCLPHDLLSWSWFVTGQQLRELRRGFCMLLLLLSKLAWDDLINAHKTNSKLITFQVFCPFTYRMWHLLADFLDRLGNSARDKTLRTFPARVSSVITITGVFIWTFESLSYRPLSPMRFQAIQIVLSDCGRQTPPVGFLSAGSHRQRDVVGWNIWLGSLSTWKWSLILVLSAPSSAVASKKKYDKLA